MHDPSQSTQTNDSIEADQRNRCVSTSFEARLALAIERVDAVDTMRVVLRARDALAIVDVRLASMSGEARLARAAKDDVVTLENRMALDRLVQARLR